MAVLTRLLPRDWDGDWDGRRLLRFLTGLALLALAFTAPVAAAPAPPPVSQAAAPISELAQAPAESVPADSAATETGATQASANGTAAERAASAGARSTVRSQECMHDGSGIPRAEQRAGETAALAGVTPGAQGSRSPPTA